MKLLEKKGRKEERQGRLESNQREQTGSPNTSRHLQGVPLYNQYYTNRSNGTLHKLY
jgi:hypothetical protein